MSCQCTRTHCGPCYATVIIIQPFACFSTWLWSCFDKHGRTECIVATAKRTRSSVLKKLRTNQVSSNCSLQSSRVEQSSASCLLTCSTAMSSSCNQRKTTSALAAGTAGSSHQLQATTEKCQCIWAQHGLQQPIAFFLTFSIIDSTQPSPPYRSSKKLFFLESKGLARASWKQPNKQDKLSQLVAIQVKWSAFCSPSLKDPLRLKRS